MKLYVNVATRIRAMIDEGVLRPGEKIFSLRQASQKYAVSISTIIKAYEMLESDGIINSHPQSGYYVSAPKPTHSKRKDIQPKPEAELTQAELVLSTLRSIREFGTVPLGSPFPDAHLFPIKKIHNYEKALNADEAGWGVLNDLPPGNESLRQQIAKRYLENGLDISPNDIVITHGATEAINLCLQAVAKPGDTIALEAPGYYALAQAVERMGMRVAEVRTHPTEGIELDALSALIQNVKVAAVLLTANFQNPTSALMPDDKKKALVALLAQHQIPLIEDDVYQELCFGDVTPKPLKAYDEQGLVLHCSSFSKSLAPGYRVGWTTAGRYGKDVERLMFLNSLSIPSAPQIAIAKFMKRDSFEQHLKSLRHTLKSNCVLMRTAIEESFPKGTKISIPTGGYVVWLELPEEIDSLNLYQQCLEKGISIAPGPLFTRKKELTNYIRLNFSHQWTPSIEQAVRTVGSLARKMLANHST
ncbi:MAG: PLP-dependent aminotransferase family protein [Methylophilaceae bacterium]